MLLLLEFSWKIGNRMSINYFSAGSLATISLNRPESLNSLTFEMVNEIKQYNTIGIDLVAMCVNDLIVQGAKPIFFLDYIATNKLKLDKVMKILDGIKQ